MDGIRQAVVLAGGKGERLRPLTDTIPKPMVSINGRPFLEYLVELLKKNGIEEIVFLLGYLPEKITEHFGDGSKFNVRIKYSIGTVADETGTRLRNAENLLQDKFLLMYSDNYWPLDLKKLYQFYLDQKKMCAVTIYKNKHHITKNNVLTDQSGVVKKYDKSRKSPGLNGVDIGFFILNKKALDLAPEGNFSFESEIFAKLVEQEQVSGYLTDHRYYSIGSLDRLPLTSEFLSPKKIIFLDRDGVINKKPPRADYVKKWSEFEFLPEAKKSITLLTKAGYKIYIITNQPGIARGFMTKNDLDDIHENMLKILKTEGGIINKIYSCLHGWDDNCDCRKPKPGLLYEAAFENHFDVTKTIFIGDDERDIQAGEAAGCKTILIQPNQSLLEIVEKMLG